MSRKLAVQTRVDRQCYATCAMYYKMVGAWELSKSRVIAYAVQDMSGLLIRQNKVKTLSESEIEAVLASLKKGDSEYRTIALPNIEGAFGEPAQEESVEEMMKKVQQELGIE